MREITVKRNIKFDIDIFKKAMSDFIISCRDYCYYLWVRDVGERFRRSD